MSVAADGGHPNLRPLAVLKLVLLIGTVGLGTVAATILGGTNPVFGLLPILLVTIASVMAKAPLRWSAAALLTGVLWFEISSDTAGIWHTPLVVLGNLLQDNLDHVVPGLKLNGLEVILLFLLAVWAHRKATRSTIDGEEVPTARVLRVFLLLYLAGFLYAEANGLLRGNTAAIWKIRLVGHVPALYLLFQAAFRGPRDHALIARIVVLTAALRAALAVYVQTVVAPALTGGELAFATSHGDSILFTVAAFILLARLVEGEGRARLVQAAAFLPLILWGMICNGRRLAWVMLAMSLGAAYLLSPARRWKRRLNLTVVVLVPVIGLYVAAGWNRGSSFFAPVHILRSVSDSSVDRSTLWREVEDWNICMSIRENPVLGVGLGGEYREFMENDDISLAYPEYRQWPHNSVLGLLLLAGLVAFTAMWSLHAAVVFLAVRSYRLAQGPDDRVAALSCVAAAIACMVTAYGDTGPNLMPYRIFWALALAVVAKLATATGAWPRPGAATARTPGPERAVSRRSKTKSAGRPMSKIVRSFSRYLFVRTAVVLFVLLEPVLAWGGSSQKTNEALPACGATCPVPAERRTSWNPGLNSAGGIPSRTAVCARISPSGGDDSAKIQAAIQRCAPDHVVALDAGDFHVPDAVQFFLKSRITIRGAVDVNGRPASRFLLPRSRQLPLFASFNMGGADEGVYVDPEPLKATAEKGSDSVRVAHNPGYSVGELVTINRYCDQSCPLLWLNPSHFGVDGSTAQPPVNRNMFCQKNRFIGQVAEIASITGPDRSGMFTLRFTAPVHFEFPIAVQDHTGAWQPSLVNRHGYYGTHATAIVKPDQWIGIENIYAQGGGAFVVFINTKYSWIKNCEIFDWAGQAISLIRSFRCEYRDSYVHQTGNPTPGGGGYALAIDWQSADNLVENNVHWACNKVMVMRSSGGGNVIGYNYFEDGFGSYYPTIPETGLNAGHFAGSHMELFEGNQSFNFGGDSVWGNSLYNVAFRNHFTGIRRNLAGVTTQGASGARVDFQRDAGYRVMAGLSPAHDYYTFIGNILGYAGQPPPRQPWRYDTTSCRPVSPAIWNVGADSNQLGASASQCDATRARTIRHGNWDHGFTNGVVWDPRIGSRELPTSLYLTSRPAFLGSETWPWVDPVSGTSHTLPARKRFDGLLYGRTQAGAGPAR